MKHDIKQMIIENFIDYFTSDETERASMKQCLYTYLEEDHVDELASVKNAVREIPRHVKYILCMLASNDDLPSDLSQLDEVVFRDAIVKISGMLR